MTTVDALRGAGHEAVHLREQALHKLPDSKILEKGAREQRVILTCDLDFGELLALGRQSVEVLRECSSALEAGAIILVEDAGFRVRRLPIIPV